MARDGPLMATAFDASVFIAAELARKSQAVAGVASLSAEPATVLKPAEISRFLVAETASLATIATIARPVPKTLPWDREIRLFVDRPCPSGVRKIDWNEIVEEAWDVHRNWGQTAFDAGWSMLDLFGCNPDPFVGRLDRNGLVASITALRVPVRLTALDDRTATLQPRNGAAMRYYRSPAPGSVPMWVAYANPAGP